jgi:hypothetical protein
MIDEGSRVKSLIIRTKNASGLCSVEVHLRVLNL